MATTKTKKSAAPPLTANMRAMLKLVSQRKTPPTSGATTAAEGARMGGDKYTLTRLTERKLVKPAKGEKGGYALTKAGAAELRK